MRPPQVVITGMGIVSAVGLGRDEFGRNLRRGVSGIRSLAERTDEGATPATADRDHPFWLGAPILDFDAKQYVRPRKALKVMCREIQTAFAASQMAVEDAGLTPWLPIADTAESRSAAIDRLPVDRLGTVFGSEMFYGPPSEMVKAFQQCLREDGSVDESLFGGAAMKGVMPLWMLKYLPNMPACQVGIALGAQGPNNTLVLGDVSGPAALIESASCLTRGHADVMVCGATGTRINTTRLNYRHDYPVYDPPADVTDHRSQGIAGYGVIGGEGSVAITLETQPSAANRDAKPLAIWLSSASRFTPSDSIRGGRRTAALCPDTPRGSSDAVASAVRAALEQADVTADDVSLVVSHRMGDPSMDACEHNGLARGLGVASLDNLPCFTPIASIGHTGAASGMFELAAAICLLSGDGSPADENADVLSMVPREAPEIALVVCQTSEGSAVATLLAKA